MLDIQTTVDGLVFKVYVQPKSSRNQISGLHGDAIKIRITSPPVAGAANKACIRFLAKQLGLSRSCLEIISGHTSRTKRLLIKVPLEDQIDLQERIRNWPSTP